MATATMRGDKTKFVNDFLDKNPQGNLRSVNEAWTADGMEGRISHPTVSEVRKELGLIGTQSAKTSKPGKKTPAPKRSKPARKKAAPKASKPALTTPGKTMFVKEFLNDHHQGNVTDVNEAWKAAGFTGTISRTLVDKTRALLGLTGNLSGKTKKARKSATGKKLGRPRKETTAAVNVKPRGNRSTVLEGIETDIDRLIFKVMGIGDLSEIEDTLRRARRLLYGALTRG